MKNVDVPQFGEMIVGPDGRLNEVGSILLQKLANALVEAQDTIADMQVTIADHEARITALEP